MSWFLFALLVGVFADQRHNRSGIGWFIIALLLSPLFSFALVAILREKRSDIAIERNLIRENLAIDTRLEALRIGIVVACLVFIFVAAAAGWF